ncbi:MAG TPA: sulfotransferase [Moraxellaceae bacterium]|nr:sulfotransferase [Moraxellaceae bacterium]
MTTTEFMPGERKVTVDQAFMLANQHHAAGRRAEAEALTRQILGIEPRHAFAWQLLAVLAHEAGQTEQAVEHMGKAIQNHPMIAQFYANRAEMNRLLGRLDQAVADAENAVRLDPRLPAAHSNLGIACYHKGDLDRAEACQKATLRLDPNYAPALNNLGSIYRDRKDRPAAVEMYRKVLALNPGFIESANNLGAVLVEMEDPEAGLKILLDVVKARPSYAEAHCNVGNAFLALEDFQRAALAFRTALQFQPDYPEAYEGLSRCAQEDRNLGDAESFARQALTLKERPAGYVLLGGIYSEQSFPDKAAEAYEKALSLNPELVSAWLGKGHLLMELGKMDDAEACFQKALALDPTNIAPRLSLTQVRKTREDDENFAILQQSATDIDGLPATKAISLHFALGKAYEDVKKYDQAFPHFLAGCKLKRQRIDYSAENNRLIAENIRKVFTPERIESLRGAGCDSRTPIFVLGMPRSGTTLTETIIASHPDVYGAGELPDLLQLLGTPMGTPPQGYPLNVEQMSKEDLTRMGETYAAQLQARAPGSPHVTDKMPANYLGIGMIHLMLPNAKIIHVKRNPVDTCVSAFTRLFNKSQHQSYDLSELGRYYRDYLSIMAHWRSVLPADAFYEIEYEQLVANQEEESKKLIAYCGLEWSDACLNPHKTERNVKTASVTQVRQPVYTSSVERWRVYEPFLGSLLAELKDVLPAS